MALGRDQDTATSLPDLKAGDRLEVSAELEVTTDLTTAELQANKGKGCYSKPYDYPPKVTAALVLATAKGRRTPAPGTAVIATKTAAVEHEAHHFVFIFNRAAIKVPSNWKGRGAVNLVLSANAARARPGHCLLVGANEPDGTVQTDMGGISVARIRGKLTSPEVIRETTLRVPALGIHGAQPPRVVYSMPLVGLLANEQLTVYARILASAAGLGTRARMSTRVFLADSPTDVEPGNGYAAQLAANKGRVAKTNGFNYLPTGPAPATEKVGVLHVTADMKQSETVFLNVVSGSGDPSKKSGSSDQLQLRPGGFLEVRRFPAGAYG